MDPHSSDFVYEPVAFFCVRKKALKKYKYLECFTWDGFLISGKNSSLPRKITDKLPSFLLRLIVFLEVFFWKAINMSTKPLVGMDVLKNDDVIFLFGYKNLKSASRVLMDIGFSGKIYIHLSHYHTFDADSYALKSLNIEFCFDNDVLEHPFFKAKYPEYKRKINIVPFAIGDRFLNVEGQSERNRKVVCGTYHDLPFDSFEIRFNGRSTLHPIRLALATHTDLPAGIENLLSLYKSNSIFSNIVGQRQHFSYDIVELYGGCAFVLVPGEGTGAIAIGTLEAMACGATVLMSDWETESLKLTPSVADYIVYDGLEQLIDILSKLPETATQSPLNVAYARKYSSHNLLEHFKNVIVS
jgi:hypothetical protein